MAVNKTTECNMIKKLSFVAWEQYMVLTRDGIGYCDISDIIRKNRKRKIANFKKVQSDFINKCETKLSMPMFKIGDKRSTWAHDVLMERLLRWYGVDEFEVIDKFVHPNCREIGAYKYNNICILIHLASTYVNASNICNVFNHKISEWLRLDNTIKLFEIYNNTCDPHFNTVVQHGLGYYKDDIWLPQKLVASLVIWCSPMYSLFVSEIMHLYHTDPMKLAATAVEEYDRQNNTHSIAVIKTTDSKEEYDEMVERMQSQIDQLENDKQIVVQRNFRLTDVNKQLDNAHFNLCEQTKGFIALRDEHGISDPTELTLTRKQMLDKNTRQE